jgi:hypothetical protein
MDLAKSLSNDVSQLHELWRQRDKLENERVGLQVEKERCGDLLFQTEGFNQTLEDDFNLIVRKLEKAQAQSDAAQRKCEEQEQALHAILPLSVETFQRLYQELQKATHELDFQTLLSLLHPEAVEQFKALTD